MSVSQHPQSTTVLNSMRQLGQQAASTQWRGLLVIRAAPKVCFQWPAEALVLAESLNDYREYLGTTQSLLVLDMRATLHADALAATVPTVRAQGLAVLVLPLHNSPFCSRLLSRLPAQLSQCLQLSLVEGDAGRLVDLSAFIPTTTPSSLAQCSSRHYGVNNLYQAQRDVFEQLVQHLQRQVRAPALLNAPRGRGKSTLLGVLAKELSSAGQPVWLCAPSRRQAATLVAAAGGRLQAGADNERINFIAPDALLADDRKLIQGQLIVDEAASLPRHMLDTLIARYPNVIMATTSEGYETCGRGFLLQFQRQLAMRFSGFLSLQLTPPIRFAANCPLEQWLNSALLLTSHTSPTHLVQNEKGAATHHLPHSADKHNPQIKYTVQHASTLSEDVLARCFELLMDAHYQTSPNDLKLLLDDPTQSLCLQWITVANTTQPILVGVVWLSKEGRLEQAIAEAVMRGTRRPPGNLLAQSLARHLQDPMPASLLWLRVVRIAVRSDYQQQGFGSGLLDYVINSHAQTIDDPSFAGVGTSFASAAQINRFWCRHGFQPVRIGSRKDSATGRRSLLMLYPHHPEWVQPVRRWASYFRHELPACQQLYHLSDDYVSSLHTATHKQPEAPTELTGSTQQQHNYAGWAERRLLAFSHSELDLNSVRPTLLTHWPCQTKDNLILHTAVHKAALSTADKQRLGVSGRKALVKQARQVCVQLLAKL